MTSPAESDTTEGDYPVEQLARRAVREHGEDAVRLALMLVPAFSRLRKGSQLALKTAHMYFESGLNASLVIAMRPAAKHAGEQVEISCVTGSSVQMMLDFDLAGTA